MMEPEKVTLTTFPRFPIVTLAVTILLTLGTLVWLVFINYYSYYALNTLSKNTVKALELSGQITHLDEVLTMSAKMAAATGDKQWEARYNTYDPMLTNVINDALLLIPAESLGTTVKQTDLANAKLVSMEHEVFRLVNAGNLGEAKNIIFSQTYESYKKEYKEGMDNYNKLLHDKIESDLSAVRTNQRYSILVSMLDFMALVFTWIITYRNIINWKRTLEQKIQSESHIRMEIEKTRNFLNEALIVNKMSDRLQTCGELSDAYLIITHTAKKLFPNLSGAMCISSETSNEMLTIEEWGNNISLKRVFSTEDCWAGRYAKTVPIV